MPKKLKKILILSGIVTLIFMPTIVAVISYFVINSLPEPIDTAQYEVSVIAPGGHTLRAEEGDEAEFKLIFLSIWRGATPCETKPISGGHSYTVSISGKERADCIFVIFDDGHGYVVGDDGMRVMAKRDLDRFLSSKYAAELYINSSMPTLMSENTYTVLPAEASWKYLALNGEMVSAEVKTRERVVTYNYSQTIGLSFSLMPDECNIKIKFGEETVFDGVFADYLLTSIDETRKLEYEIEAKWSQKIYSGSAHYHFFADLGKPAEFSIQYGKYEDNVSFALISAKNIGILEDAMLSVSPDITIDPKFTADGSSVRALIPFSHDDPEGVYTVMLYYGGVIKEFDIDYTKRESAPSSNPYPAEDASTVKKYRDEYLSLINRVGEMSSGTVYMSGNFIDPEDQEDVYGDSCSLLVGFGRIRKVDGTDTEFRNDGIVYRTSGGVYSLDAGKIIATGKNDWLGNYAVVDHGLGLCSWYGNLLSVDVKTGDTVKRGQSLGMAGNTGYTQKDSYGFYLMTTVYGVPISPYALLEDGISLN